MLASISIMLILIVVDYAYVIARTRDGHLRCSLFTFLTTQEYPVMSGRIKDKKGKKTEVKNIE